MRKLGILLICAAMAVGAALYLSNKEKPKPVISSNEEEACPCAPGYPCYPKCAE